jgi:RNA 2',3'-cyclic 3'-phosphodiesterase
VRLFVAINLPADERDRIHRATTVLRNAGLPVRWAAPASFHLTLEFLGPADESRVAQIVPVLETAARGVEPFDMELKGVGGFPNLRRPRVLWVGVSPSDALMTLQANVAAGLSGIGFKPEGRAYHPHITLGRSQSEPRSKTFAGVEDLAGHVRIEATIRAGTVDLMETRLNSRGTEYHCIEAIAFGNGVMPRPAESVDE